MNQNNIETMLDKFKVLTEEEQLKLLNYLKNICSNISNTKPTQTESEEKQDEM